MCAAAARKYLLRESTRASVWCSSWSAGATLSRSKRLAQRDLDTKHRQGRPRTLSKRERYLYRAIIVADGMPGSGVLLLWAATGCPQMSRRPR